MRLLLQHRMGPGWYLLRRKTFYTSGIWKQAKSKKFVPVNLIVLPGLQPQWPYPKMA